MTTIHQQLIRDTADLIDVSAEELTPASMSAIGVLLDRLDVLLNLATVSAPSSVPA
jgi:hypothetical protein